MPSSTKTEFLKVLQASVWSEICYRHIWGIQIALSIPWQAVRVIISPKKMPFQGQEIKSLILAKKTAVN